MPTDISQDDVQTENPLLSCTTSCILFHHKGHESFIQRVIVTLISWVSSYRILFLLTAAATYKVAQKLG